MITGSSPDKVIEYFSVYLILPATPWDYAASNRNEYQKIFRRVKQAQRIRLATYLPSVSQLSRKCGILDISQPHRPPWPVTGITLLFTFYAA
jgi:hypothetical protein